MDLDLDSESSFNHLVKIISNKDTKRNQDIHSQERNTIKSPKINFLSAKIIKFVRKFINFRF